MKSIKSALTAVSLAVLMLGTGCSHKTTSTAQALNAEEVAVNKVRSQQLAEEKPGIRAWGEGTHMNQSFAKTYAEGQARAEFARKLASSVQTASRQATDGALTYNSDGQNAGVAEDQGILSNAFAQQVADGVINGTVIINSDVFKKRDGQYHVYVCIEWQGGVDQLAEKMTQGYRKKVEQLVSDEDRVKMEVRYEDFKNSIQEELNRLKGE